MCRRWLFFFFFSSRRRHTRYWRDWSSDVCSSDLDQEKTMAPIFDTIIDHIPAPVDNSAEPLQFQVSLLDYNDFVGRIGIGRVFRGTVKVGDQVTLSKLDGTTKNFRVTKLFGFFGLERKEIQERSEE